jgi:hypothetical protein
MKGYRCSQKIKMAVNLLEILSYRMQVLPLNFSYEKNEREFVSITARNHLADVFHNI